MHRIRHARPSIPPAPDPRPPTPGPDQASPQPGILLVVVYPPPAIPRPVDPYPLPRSVCAQAVPAGHLGGSIEGGHRGGQRPHEDVIRATCVSLPTFRPSFPGKFEDRSYSEEGRGRSREQSWRQGGGRDKLGLAFLLRG